MKTRNVFKLDNETVTLTILDVTPVNGEKPEKPEVLVERKFNLDEIPDQLEDGEGLSSLKAYGLSSILQDRCSDMTDSKLGPHATSTKELAEMRSEAYDDVFQVLASGKMRKERASGGKTATVDSYFAEGFARFLQSQGKDVDATTAATILNSRSAEERKALRKHEKIAGFVAEAKREASEAAKGINLEALLG